MKRTFSLAPLRDSNRLNVTRDFAIWSISLIVLSGCESYRYDSVPDRLQLSPVRCDDIWVGNRLRNEWTHRNAKWLKKTIGNSYASENAQRVALSELDARLGERFYGGCTIGFTIFKSNNGFSSEGVQFSNMTTEVSFEESSDALQLCLHSYPTRYRDDRFGTPVIHVLFEPQPKRTCITVDRTPAIPGETDENSSVQ